MSETDFDETRPDKQSIRETGEAKRVIDPKRAVDELVKKEEGNNLLGYIDLQMVVGSAGMILEGLLPATARQIKDLDTVTVVSDGEIADRIRDFFDENRGELGLCNETSDVFVVSPLTGKMAKRSGKYPMDSAIHMLTWARPYVIKMSDHFRNKVLAEACRGILSEAHLAELSDSYLVAAASIGGLLEEDLSSLSTKQVRELVDLATEYKLEYYTGEHDDYGIKTSVGLPRELRYGRLRYKLSEWGIK